MASLARTIAVQPRPLPNATELRWPDRDVGDVLDYTLDLTIFLADCADLVAGVPLLTASPADLVISQATIAGNAITWLIAGGVFAGSVVDYALQAIVQTAGGRTIERTVWLRSGRLSVNASYASDLVVTGALSLGGTIITALDPTVFANVGGTMTLTFPPLIPDGVTIVAGDDNMTISTTLPVPDGLTILDTGGVLSVASTPFASLPNVGISLPADQFEVVRNGTVSSMTIAQLALDVGAVLQPALAIDQIADQPVSTPFVVTGEVLNYQFVPVLSYADPDGVVHALPSGSVVTSSSYTFTHPGLLAASNVVLTVRDANGISAASMPYNVSPTIASAAVLTGVPATSVHGVALAGISLTLTPSNASVWVILLGPNGQEGARVPVLAGPLPALVPAMAGSYRILVFASHGGGPKLLASNAITVT